MKKIYIFILFSLSSFLTQAQENFWTNFNESKSTKIEKTERASMPEKFNLFSLDFESFKTKLFQAPLDLSSKRSNLKLTFPNAKGEFHSFEIYEAPVMDKELENKYPGIKSYVGIGIDQPASKIRFSVTMFGLHTMTFNEDGTTTFIDTYTKDNKGYIVYNKSDIAPSRNFQCHVTEKFELDNSINVPNFVGKASDSQFRVFRLAMACTIEYAAYHVNAAGLNGGTLAQKKAAVLAAMNVTMTRVNGIYERDMSMRMTLIPTNDQIIFIDSDNFSNDTASSLINESQSQITSIIGTANFDIGHTVSTGGGGLAGPSPCVANSKARGITGSPAPVGDPYDIDYVAHEMGHQFGANHTFNNSCSGNVNNGTAVEPGSGSTIMAYAGICAPNVQNNSDAHFHAVSIAEMVARIASTATCAPNNPNGNTPPVANAGADFTIPKGTAFILKGSATDANGDSLTYCWEQTNTEISTQPPLQTSTTGPNYRSNPPVTSPNRYLPNLQSVLAGNLAPTWEVTPSVARTMNFALTVRDNRAPNGGQTHRDNTVITVGNTTAPFEVTSQATNVTWTAGATETITWNVVGTAAAPYNSPNVDILLTSDNGATFTTLLSNTPNDGTQQITVPSISQPFCKVLVMSRENIFYAVNKGNISIGYTVTYNDTCQTFSATPNATIVEQNPLAYQNFTLVIPAMPGVITDVNVSTNISHRVNQIYVRVNHPDNTAAQLLYGDQTGCTNGISSLITTFDDGGANFACASAGSNIALKSTDPLSVFNGKTTAGNWRFRVADVVTNNSGTLNSFSFNICTRETIVTLSNNEFEFTGFNVYPNPSNGIFDIEFNSNDKNTSLTIVDLRGRKVHEELLNDLGLIKKRMNLSNFQKGVYIINLTDGVKKSTKKIIIE